MTAPIHEYAQQLTAKLPEQLQVCYFVNSGSEANDLALLMARLHTGRFDVITMRNGYHGLTQTLLGATNLSTWKQPTPTGFGIWKTMNADPYRGPWGGSHCRDSPSQTKRKCDCKPNECKAGDQYVDQLQQTLDYDIPVEGPAAFLIESIQGVGGTVQYPHNFVRDAFDRIRKKNGLCISDEVQTGFGRLGGAFWGFEMHGVVPDIVTMAKGIGNGFPMGAIVTTEAVAQSLRRALHFNTFGGNPLACSVGSAVLRVIDEEKLQENSAKVGTYMIEQLMTIGSRLIGDIRGQGLMIGIELIEQDGRPLNATAMGDIFEKTKDYGILVGKGGLRGNVLRIKPPMCISKSDADTAVEVIGRVLREAEQQH